MKKDNYNFSKDGFLTITVNERPSIRARAMLAIWNIILYPILQFKYSNKKS